jgi:putative peptide zinc metalloprotease protein
MERPTTATDLERRKQVKLRIRTDLAIAPQKYEGRTYYVVKDPVSLRYYRFEEQEHFLIELMNGSTTLDDAQKAFEKRFRPKRLTLEDLEGFGQQLLKAGLAHNESPQAGTQLFERRRKRKRTELMQYVTNILYIKIPVFDPDKLLGRMLPYLRFIFTTWFFVASILLMLSAVLLVLTHFEMFREKLPAYHEFFNVKTVVNLWVALGVVKVIHEFGHGLSCKAFGGEVHEMGALFLCLSPCLYCNVSDAWTLANKWQRIIISFAGIYVELVIASIATFVWWNSANHPFINNLSLSLMVVCSVSTVLFNANPLMRFDGYYVVADWMEIPNLRDRSNKFLKELAQVQILGMEVPPEQYMTLSRRILFVTYALVSYIYRWVITFSILYFLSIFLKPYKLGAISQLLAVAAAGSMIGWPLYRMGQGLHKRGRLPDMKPQRITAASAVLAVVLLLFFLLPLPVSRVRQTSLIQVEPESIQKVSVPEPAVLERLLVKDGQSVQEGDILAEFRSLELENQLEEARTQYDIRVVQLKSMRRQLDGLPGSVDKAEKNKVQSAMSTATGERDSLAKQVEAYDNRLKKLVVRAPRSGVVMSPPHVDEVGKLWDKDQTVPLCIIGDPNKLQALMPVSPADYRLLKEDLAENPDLKVTIRVMGRAEQTWQGKVGPLPEQEAKEIPAALSSKLGGPLAVKTTTQPDGAPIPQSQQYLIPVDFLDPDNRICPGTLAQVKVHCRWRSCAWWAWRTVSSVFDLGLL